MSGINVNPNFGTNNPRIDISNSNCSAFIDISNQFLNFSTNTGNINLYTNSKLRIQIMNSGNVGITVPNPQFNLDADLTTNCTNAYFNNTLPLGYQAGYLNQNTNAIAVGFQAGNTNQGTYSIAMGYQAGYTNQGSYAIGLGYRAGYTNQGSYAIAIGTNAGNSLQGQYSIAIGAESGIFTQGQYAIGLGYRAGYNSQGQYGIGIGQSAGQNTQGQYAIGIGANGGYDQRDYAIAIGITAGFVKQGTYGIGIGTNAGQNSQGTYAISIGRDAGRNSQGQYAIAIGAGSNENVPGYNIQGQYAIGIGFMETAKTGQGTYAIGIGYQAGSINQKPNAIAIGVGSGYDSQQLDAISFGHQCAIYGQGTYAIAFTPGAAYYTQGQYAIALGRMFTNQHANSIGLNSTGFNLLTQAVSSTYIQPLRSTANTGNVLLYNTTSFEVMYNTTAGKTFVIPHPINSNKYLVHACLEGPELGVYYRGKGEIVNDTSTIVYLPEYVDKLATDFTIQLTPIYQGKKRTKIYTSTIQNNQFTVYGANGKFHWFVQGKRGDVDIEPDIDTTEVYGNGPYKWIRPANKDDACINHV